MMTITQEQFEAARRKAGIGPVVAREFANELSITIAPPEPSEAMVKLAREIAATAADKDGDTYFAAKLRAGDADDSWAALTALATLQHVEKLVRDAQNGAGSVEDGACGYILKRIGSNRHD